jgi:prepilin-type N-terminal cleavage/methylation domain-containing protein
MNDSRLGMTLIELLVVIAIISILYYPRCRSRERRRALQNARTICGRSALLLSSIVKFTKVAFQRRATADQGNHGFTPLLLTWKASIASESVPTMNSEQSVWTHWEQAM